MQYSKSDIERIKNALLEHEGMMPLLHEARNVIIQLEKENALLKEQINAAGLPGKCCTCSQFINRIGNVGVCKIRGREVVRADQDCICPKLREASEVVL